MSKITEKIAKLLALAESPYEEEAKAALLQARRLMAEHKLMPEDIEPQENKKVIQECVGVTCTKLSSPWTVYLSTLIAAHYCCRPYRSSVHGSKISEIGFIGMEDDFKQADSYRKGISCKDASGDVQFLWLGLLPRAVCRFSKAGDRTPGMGIGYGRAAGGRGRRFQNEAEQL